MKKIKLLSKFEAYWGIIYFFLILLIAHFVWKLLLSGDEFGASVRLLGMDISAPFIWMSDHIARATFAILDVLGVGVRLQAGNILRHDSGGAICIVWGCTGFKQAYIYLCIIAFYRGPWRHKLWYIPLGWLLIYCFNLFRISFITAYVGHHPEQFDFLHGFVFKYLFYGLIFLMWVVWEEVFVLKRRKKKANKRNSFS